MDTQPAADPIALANQLTSKSRSHTTNNVEVERRHLLDGHGDMQSAYTCGKSDGPVQQQRSREAQQATMGDTAFRGVSLPSSCVMILFCVVIIFSVWVFSPVYPPKSPPTNLPDIPTNSPGNDYPIPSNSYVFTVYGTDQAFTLSSREDIILATYSNTNQNQIFRCDWVPSTNRLGFVNIPTNRRILRNRFEDVRARPHGNPSVWESFALEPLPGGGFRMSSMIGDVSSALRLVDEAGKPKISNPICVLFFFLSLANVIM